MGRRAGSVLSGWRRISVRHARSALAMLMVLPVQGHAEADAGASQAPTLALGRSLSADFWAGRLEPVWARMSPGMRAAVGNSPAGLAMAREQILASVGGGPGELLAERVLEVPGAQRYLRTFRGSREVDPFLEAWTIVDGQTVAGFVVRHPELKAAASKYLDYVPHTVFRLPVKGTWTVLWGGRTLEQNQHAAVASQRFAMDLAIVREGKTSRGAGKELSDYFCWDSEVFAPADGSVVSAVDGLTDALDSKDTMHPAGNNVVLDHGNGEFSLLAHLRRGSVAVKPGQRIAAGNLIGRCGSSGNTSEPHLHVQAMDGPEFFAAESFPMPFSDILVDGKPVARAELLRGQTVSPAPTVR